MPDFSSITIIYNPKSTGDSEKNAFRLQKKLWRTRYRNVVKIAPTKYAGHAEEIASDIARNELRPFIISSSGDGGYNEVVNGVMNVKGGSYHPVTGLLPSGNANDHYKQLHKPYLIRQILSGSTQVIDVLKLSAKVDGRPWQRYAHSYIGFGLSSEVGKALNAVDLNSKNELLIFMKTLLNSKPFTISINYKNTEFHNIILSNVGKMSKVLSLSKTTKVDDGKFEVFTSDSNKVNMLSDIVKSVTLGVPHEDRTSRYAFNTIKALDVQLDGEVRALDPNCLVAVTIQNKSLHCII